MDSEGKPPPKPPDNLFTPSNSLSRSPPSKAAQNPDQASAASVTKPSPENNNSPNLQKASNITSPISNTSSQSHPTISPGHTMVADPLVKSKNTQNLQFKTLNDVTNTDKRQMSKPPQDLQIKTLNDVTNISKRQMSKPPPIIINKKTPYKMVQDLIKVTKLNCSFKNLASGDYQLEVDNVPEYQMLLSAGFDIVIIAETWMDTLPNFNDTLKSKFSIIYSKACRTSGRGRLSGGLIMFCSNRFELICLDICKHWIFVRISLNNCSLVLGGLYLSPSDDARRLFDDLSEFLVSVDSDRLLIMSDLNSRIGEGNRIDEMILSGCSVSASRTSRDKTLNTIGLACLGFLSACGLLVLNGRTVSDAPANFTFVGHNGKSVIDLMLINLTLADFVVDSGILDVGNCSQHFPYFVDLSLFAPSALEHSADCVYKLTWCPELSGIFNVLLEDLMVDSVSTSLEVNSYSCSLSSCITDAAHTLGMIKGRRIGHGRGAASKPWFNEECFRAKRFFRQLRRKCRLSNFEGDSHSRFVEARSAYGNLIRSTKTSYLKNIANQLADSSSPSEFWRIIGSLRSRGSGSANLLSPADVDAHFRNTFNFFTASPPPSSLIHRPTFHDPSLDLDISSDELNLALDCSKIGKAAGRDGITFEFYKSLNDRNRIFLLNLFNGVLHEEKTPDNWSKLKMFLLYKKGDPSLPSNFRGITLMNAITKLFTSILATRIALWADSRGLLPETQNGFRKGRSCIDNIFVLSSCIGERLRNKHGTLLAFFVDFKQAFDRINHDRLWIKLSDMGLSLKIISVLRSFYCDAEVKILINHSASTVVPIKNGVLQGDCLSPLLFSLYLSDFDAFFRMYECPCIDVDSLHSINSIFFADDLVLMASSPIRMKKLISTLAIYCKENLLEVNLSKSKMIVFRRGGKLAQAFNFSYNGEFLILNS